MRVCSAFAGKIAERIDAVIEEKFRLGALQNGPLPPDLYAEAKSRLAAVGSNMVRRRGRPFCK